LPSATWAASHNNMVTFTAATLPGRAGCDRRRRVRCNDARSAHTDRPVTALKGLRDDVYRRPLATALDRLGVEGGWRCVDVGAGGGTCRSRSPRWSGETGGSMRRQRSAARDEAAAAAAATARCSPSPRRPRSCSSPSRWTRLLPVPAPPRPRPGGRGGPDGKSGAPGRLGRGARADHDSGAVGACPVDARRRHPDIGALAPGLVRDAGLTVVDAWAEAPAGVGPGPVATYLESLTGVDPGDDPIVLPPLVTVLGENPAASRFVPMSNTARPDFSAARKLFSSQRASWRRPPPR